MGVMDGMRCCNFLGLRCLEADIARSLFRMCAAGRHSELHTGRTAQSRLAHRRAPASRRNANDVTGRRRRATDDAADRRHAVCCGCEL